MASVEGFKGGTEEQNIALQKALEAAGFPVGGVDGKVGKNTRAALEKFMVEHGDVDLNDLTALTAKIEQVKAAREVALSDEAQEIADKFRKQVGEDAVPEPAAAAPVAEVAATGIAAEIFDRNNAEHVKAIQTALNENGFKVKVDGIAEDETNNALDTVKALLGSEGVGFDPAKLTNQELIEKVKKAAENKKVVEMSAQEPEPVVLQPAVETFDIKNAEHVKALQTALNENGFDAGKVDGDFGKRSKAAVSAMLTELGEDASLEISALTTADLVAKANAAGAARAAKAEEAAQAEAVAKAEARAKLADTKISDLDRDGVRALQEMLVENGIYPGKVDGLMGQKTKGAIAMALGVDVKDIPADLTVAQLAEKAKARAEEVKANTGISFEARKNMTWLEIAEETFKDKKPSSEELWARAEELARFNGVNPEAYPEVGAKTTTLKDGTVVKCEAVRDIPVFEGQEIHIPKGYELDPAEVETNLNVKCVVCAPPAQPVATETPLPEAPVTYETICQDPHFREQDVGGPYNMLINGVSGAGVKGIAVLNSGLTKVLYTDLKACEPTKPNRDPKPEPKPEDLGKPVVGDPGCKSSGCEPTDNGVPVNGDPKQNQLGDLPVPTAPRRATSVGAAQVGGK